MLTETKTVRYQLRFREGTQRQRTSQEQCITETCVRDHYNWAQIVVELGCGMENRQTVPWSVRVGGGPLDFSNPLASKPKYRSSIHHAICLMRGISGYRGCSSRILPNSETI